MVIGFAIAWLFYIKAPHLPAQLADSQPGLYRFLLNKWYFDELYDIIFVRPAKWLGRLLWKKGDGMIIDGLGPTASPPAWSTSPRQSCACRPATSTTTPSRC